MEIWHLKDAAQIVLLVLTFGPRIYSAPVISLVKHSSRPVSFPFVWTEKCSLLCQKERKHGENTQKNPSHFWGPNKTHSWRWLRGPGWGHLFPTGFWWYLEWGNVTLVALRWPPARPPHRCNLQWLVTQFCHRSVYDEAFPVGRDDSINPFASQGSWIVRDGLLQLRDGKALCGAGEDMTAKTSSSKDWDWDWDYCEKK